MNETRLKGKHFPSTVSNRGVGEGGQCPPTFESRGAQPLQFFISLCAVVTVWLYGDYSPIIRILQYYNW